MMENSADENDRLLRRFEQQLDSYHMSFPVMRRPRSTAFNRSLAIFRRLGDRHHEGKALMNLANESEDSAEALKLLTKALKIAREVGDVRDEANVRFNMGGLLYRLGQREKAFDYTEEARRTFELIEDPNAPLAQAKLIAWRLATESEL
jgi:tetratricopeptide (TPR) repeat protein